MAVRADFDLQIMTQRGAREERIPAAANHVGVFVFRMNAGFHGVYERKAPLQKKGAQCSHATGAPQAKDDRHARDKNSTAAARQPVGKLSTKAVDKCVDSVHLSERQRLQKCDIVKLIKNSPPIFPIILQ